MQICKKTFRSGFILFILSPTITTINPEISSLYLPLSIYLSLAIIFNSTCTSHETGQAIGHLIPSRRPTQAQCAASSSQPFGKQETVLKQFLDELTRSQFHDLLRCLVPRQLDAGNYERKQTVTTSTYQTTSIMIPWFCASCKDLLSLRFIFMRTEICGFRKKNGNERISGKEEFQNKNLSVRNT